MSGNSSGRGLFIDFDGTLADSLGVMRGVYDEFLERFGVKGSDAEFRELNGPPLDRVVETLKDRHGLTDPAARLREQYGEAVREVYRRVEPSAGAGEMLDHADRHGWEIVVVTSNSETLASAWLEAKDLLGSISHIVGAESVKVGKPDPEPYLIALERAECVARSSLAVEDSPAGIASASSARIPTFAYAPRGVPPGGLPPEITVIRRLVDLKPWLAHV